MTHNGPSSVESGSFRWDWVVVLVGAFTIGLVAAALPRFAATTWCVSASYWLGRWDAGYGAKWRARGDRPKESPPRG